MQARTARVPSPPLIWRNVTARRIALQAAVLAVVLLIGWVLVGNLLDELDRTGLEAMPFIDLEPSFPFIEFQQGFLSQRAGFGIGQTSFGVDYSPNDSYLAAYRVGLANTFRVAVLGIVFATVIGLIAGISRLSKNWLVAHIAEAYVETFRNVPLLVQLIFWYTAVALRLPTITDSFDLLGIMLVSNRGVAVSWAEPRGGFGVWMLLLAASVVVAAMVWVTMTRREEESGQPRYPWWAAFGTFVLLGALAFFATGLPLDFQRPVLEGRAFEGGAQLSPEFVSLLVGLVLYTGAFIAEVVRGSILAIPHGQMRRPRQSA